MANLDFVRIFVLMFLVTFCAECSSKKGDNGIDYDTKITIKQYVAAGRQLYKHNCANCHQENGEGLASLYPPLRNADFVVKNIPQVVCIMKHGHEGEIVVNGRTFDQKMPANENLTNLELSELATFLMNEFNDSLMIVDQHEVAGYLQNCDSMVVGP